MSSEASPPHFILLASYWLSAESLCLNCALWHCYQPLLRLIRNSPVPTACGSPVWILLRKFFTLYVLCPLHEDSQEKLISDLSSSRYIY